MRRMTNMSRFIIRKKKHYSNQSWNVELIHGDLLTTKVYDVEEYKADKEVERLAALYTEAKVEEFSP
tara:strand:- start:311 stop:511 length:201 start_codon:yes stop_codon:yes gene_type:complete